MQPLTVVGDECHIVTPGDGVIAEQILLTGRAQGMGLRPAILRWASQCGVAGAVCNTSAGVDIHVEGTVDCVQHFARGLIVHLPASANVGMSRRRATPTGASGFNIARADPADEEVTVEAPTDKAVCPQCLREVLEPADRRAEYPFASCTQCGPRYTIIKQLPYERPLTTMAAFELCPTCQHEYESPADRRFHAQTNACPACGPQVWCVDQNNRLVGEKEVAIVAAVRALLLGQIVALRGLGGYQLVCDATDEAAVGRLRGRKGRSHKPLAVMVENLAAAERIAKFDLAGCRMLADSANPIVVLASRSTGGLSAQIHPGLNEVGVFLPTTPLHALLLRGLQRPLIVTSGNREGEPLEHECDAAFQRLAGIADLWLHHNRPIHHPLDDSVVRMIAGHAVTLRLARGLAPLSLRLPHARPLLTLGGQQRAAAALCNGAQSVLAPHVGDLETPAAWDRYLGQQRCLLDLYRTSPTAIVHDLHPQYTTTRWASEQSLPTLPVQHHHAHVAAGMLEAGWLDRTVLGVAWDGTGYGQDGTIWGGEFLQASLKDYRRLAHLRPFRLPGGEAAIRQPWRVAVSLVAETLGEDAALGLRFRLATRRQIEQILPIAAHRSLSPLTTSAGRLFDAVAALVLGVENAAYEGFPAMLLEAACDESDTLAYSVALQDGMPLELDWRPLIAAIQKDLQSAVSPGAIAMRFHRALAAGILAVCSNFANLPVVLAGGVFQNRVLTELVADGLEQLNRPVALPGRIPPGDGGLAAGQLAIACATFGTTRSS